MAVHISIIRFLIYLGILFVLQKKGKSFNVRVVTGLFGGIIFGAILETVADDAAVSESLRWISLVGTAHTKLLRAMAIPLIFVSIVCAIINQKSGKNLGKITALVLAILLSTVAVAAVVGGVMVTASGAGIEGPEVSGVESKKISQLEKKAQEGISFEDTIIDTIPPNPIYALTGQGNNATLSVVLFAAFPGIGMIGVRTYVPEQAEFFGKIMNSPNTLVAEVVTMIIMLTPFGISSLMTKTIVGSNYTGILRFVTSILASYTAIFVMFITHGLILAAVGVSPLIYSKKAVTTLIFAFISCTSVETLPLTIRALTDEMGVDNGAPNLTGSLSIPTGQNGCAIIYPAMLVVMAAPAVGQPITSPFFILMVIIITFASIGIAGVGGGATFVGIIVLPVLELPVDIVGLLVGIEPVVDMARTALNINDGMVTGLVAAKLTKNIDMNIYDGKSVNLEKKSASSRD